ncbi:MAG TPA: PAS domain S-box protein [Thermoanaerobaculia bacterium]|nr:PAS domain S-box protein [Thermoanaerobaculia bacterium]
MRPATSDQISCPIPDARLGPWASHALAVLAVAGALGVRWLLGDILGEASPFLVFVVAVLLTARFGGFGPGLLATGLSALTATYFFLPPFGSLVPSDTASVLQLIIFCSIGVTVSLLNARLVSASGWALSRLNDLRETEERFRLLVEGVEDHALFMLDPQGRVVLWNRGAERLKGYRPDEILGRHLSIFYPAEEQQNAELHLREAEAQGRYQEEGWRVRKDGSRFWAHAALTALRDPEGNLRGYAKITRDITGRKQAEEEIHQLNESLEQRVIERTAQLEEANHALEAFAYSVSHDLRAPLRAMQGFAEALVEDYGEQLDETGREYAQRVVGAAGRMDLLINDLLSYSRISRADATPQTVSLETAAEEARQSLELEMREHGGTIEIGSGLPAVRAHRPTLVQVLINLLGNALRFVAPGVTPRVRVWAEPRGEKVRLWIEDNGIGIAPEHQERIFRVFERLHGVETYSGTGVGLGIVRKGMERMGGSSGVESAPGEGSRFWIELPMAGGSA